MKFFLILLLGIFLGWIGNSAYSQFLLAGAAEELQNNLAEVCSELDF